MLTEAESRIGRAPTKMSPSRRAALIAVALTVACVAVFGQVWDFRFVRLDDSVYVTGNPEVRNGLTASGVAWAFTTFRNANWHPLTWISLMLDAELGGGGPRLFHVTNLILHLANALLLFRVFERLTGAVWRSAFVAGMFAVHPLHVESVAWVSERKDVLSTLFWLFTMLAYLRHVERPGAGRYGLVVILFALGLAAKPMLVTLPCVLLLLDFWPLGRIRAEGLRRIVVEKIPLLALAAASSVVTVLAQSAGGALESLDRIPIGLRVSNAVLSYGDYILKTLWPAGLSVLYPYVESPSPSKVALYGFVLIAASFVVWRFRSERPYLAFGWLWYLGTLVPVIGLVQVGTQSMADRYTYIPLVGLFVMAAWGVPDLLPGTSRARGAVSAVAVLMILAMIPAAHLQTRHWRNSRALYSRALAVTGPNAIAHNGLAAELQAAGSLDEAAEHFRRALRIEPRSSFARLNLAAILIDQGRVAEAIEQYREAAGLNLRDAETRANLGIALTRMNRLEEAAQAFTDALSIDPRSAQAHRGYAVALVRLGRGEEAVTHLRAALDRAPTDASARVNLGILLMRLGRAESAETEFLTALEDDPGNASGHRSYGILLLRAGRPEQALRHLSEAVRLDPADTDARRYAEQARVAARAADPG